MQTGVSLLEDLVNDFPDRVLAGIKLWQFYRVQGGICSPKKKEDVEENFDSAFKVADQILFTYHKQQEMRLLDWKMGKSKRPPPPNIEHELLVSLINVKSLLEMQQFCGAFEIL